MVPTLLEATAFDEEAVGEARLDCDLVVDVVTEVCDDNTVLPLDVAEGEWLALSVRLDCDMAVDVITDVCDENGMLPLDVAEGELFALSFRTVEPVKKEDSRLTKVDDFAALDDGKFCAAELLTLVEIWFEVAPSQEDMPNHTPEVEELFMMEDTVDKTGVEPEEKITCVLPDVELELVADHT